MRRHVPGLSPQKHTSPKHTEKWPYSTRPKFFYAGKAEAAHPMGVPPTLLEGPIAPLRSTTDCCHAVVGRTAPCGCAS